MSLLDADFEQQLEDNVALHKLIHDTDLTNKMSPYIATSFFQPRSRYNPVQVKGLERISRDKLNIIRGEFRCPDCTVIAGDIDWKQYGVTEIMCYGHITFIHNSANLPNVSKITASESISFQMNTRAPQNIKLRAPRIAFMSLMVGSEGFNNCTFNCEELKLGDLPKSFVNVRGYINTMRISLMEIGDIERVYGNWVIPQTVGPKKIKRIADVRAFYNNPKKYKRYWVHPSELIDVNGLIKSMQLDDALKEYLYLSDCGFEMVFHKRDGRWYCNECSKK